MKVKILIVVCIALLMALTLNLISLQRGYNIQEVSGSERLVAKRGDKIVLQAKLIDDLGNPVENETIFFFDETHDVLLGKNNTNSNGVATFSWYVPLNFSIGPLLLNITYYGNSQNFLLSSSSHIAIDIVAELHILHFVTDSTGDKKDRTVAPTDWVFFNVSVIDDLSSTMSNIDVVVVDENNILLAHNITDGQGNTLLKFQVPSTWIGLKPVFIKTNCTDSYIINSESKILLNVSKIEKITNVFSFSKIVYYGDIQNISGKLTDEYGTPLKNVQVYLLDATENIITTTITNGSGMFHLSAKITKDLFNVGKNLIFLTSDETNKYMASKVSLYFTVKSKSTIVTNIKNNSILIANEAYNISILLQDQFNSSISKSNITLIFEGVNYTVSTDNTGVAYIYLFILPERLGKNNFTFVYEGNSNYSSCILVSHILIYEKPIIKIESPTESIFTVGEIIHINGSIESQFLLGDNIRLDIFLVNYSGFSKLIGIAKVRQNGSFSFDFNTTNIALSSQKKSFMLKLVIPRNDSIYLEESYIVKNVILTTLIKTKCKLVNVFNEKGKMVSVFVIRLEMFNDTGVAFENITVNISNISRVISETNKTGYTTIRVSDAKLTTTTVVIIKVVYTGNNIFLPCENIFYVKISELMDENKDFSNSNDFSMSELTDWGLVLTPVLVTVFYMISKRKDDGIVRLNKMLGG